MQTKQSHTHKDVIVPFPVENKNKSGPCKSYLNPYIKLNQKMTKCNRCGNEFDNFFQGAYWCVYCGKQFLFDENLMKKQEESKKRYKKKD